MKTIKQKPEQPETSRIDRSLISKFGNIIYNSSDVSRVMIGVKFKDGSAINFKRSEAEDTMGDFFGGDD